MSDYLDALTFTKNESTGKWRATRVGYAKPDKDGTGWEVYVDAWPVSGRLSLRPQRDRDDAGGNTPPRASRDGDDYSAGRAAVKPRDRGDADDEIPF